MTYEEHYFLSKWLFYKKIEIKKKLHRILYPHEMMPYEEIDKERRRVYEELAYLLIKNFNMNIEKDLPF